MSRKATTKSSLPSTNKSTNKRPKKPLNTVKLICPDSRDEPPSKKPRAGFTLSKPPVFDLTKDDVVMESSSQGPSSSQMSKPPMPLSQRPLVDIKGKSRETKSSAVREDDRLWVDKYEPRSEAELAVHKRKVEDVRHWLLEALEGGPSAKLRKYRRILALTGPAGTAKTATLRVLSKELDFEILEWRNSMNERGPSSFADDDEERQFDTETLFDKFQAFLTRAMTCNSVFANVTAQKPASSGSRVPPQSSSQSAASLPKKRQLILLEDLPNLLHQPTQARFQAALRSLCIPAPNFSDTPGPPIIIIVSDSGLRAEQPDDDTWDGGTGGRRWDPKEVLDVRNVLGPELLTSPHVTRIAFNPIAPTLMTKALQALLSLHFDSSESHCAKPSRDVIDIIVESSNGDIRSATMALQFACIVDLAASTKTKGKIGRKNPSGTKVKNVRAVLEAVTRREQSLVLFHLLGKILYNKRKFDPPASHLSAKDIAKEREMDTQLEDPSPLPTWLSHHDRKASRVCIQTLAAESPIDSSLLGLYTHQNYTKFCTDIDQCDGVCEGLSWVDCMGGTQMMNTPYAFPTLALSTLHSLPTPVPRTGQKVCKPIWFDVRTREIDASDAVGDVLGWLGRGIGGGTSELEAEEGLGSGSDGPSSSMSIGKWTEANVATELGAWLRALERWSGSENDAFHPFPLGGVRSVPPRTHRSFSYMPWSYGSTVGGDALGECDDDGVMEGGGAGAGEEDVTLPGGMKGGHVSESGWLEEDDIEEVE